MSRKILVVDDEPHIAQIMKLTLEYSGYEVTVAGDGAEGLKMAKEWEPDLILLDLMLPNIDGFKVCRLLKFDQKYRHIPIILVSAMGETKDKELGKQVGADLYISKPFKQEELVAQVENLLKQRSGLSG
jgi:DNA-binding response OmpR family regulator